MNREGREMVAAGMRLITEMLGQEWPEPKPERRELERQGQVQERELERQELEQEPLERESLV